MTHDELVMWTERNAGALVERYVAELTPPRFLHDGVLRYEWEIQKTVWEHPVGAIPRTDYLNKFKFIDLVIFVRFFGERREVVAEPIGKIGYFCYLRGERIFVGHEWKDVVRSGLMVHGIKEEEVTEDRQVVRKFEEIVPVLVEAKPRISDLGELIRQLRSYYVNPGRSAEEFKVVVSPDSRHRATIEAPGQGFRFFEAPADLRNFDLGL